MKRQFAWSIAPLLVVTVVNLFSVRLFFKYLGDDMYALWGYVATFTGMFGFADLGLGVAVGRYVGVALGKGDHAAVREYWGTGNLIALPMLGAVALLFAGLGAAFGPHWFNVSAGNENLLRGCFVAGGAALFLNYYSQFWNILSQAHLDFKFIGILRTGVSLLQIIPAILIAITTRNPLLITIWGAGIALLQLLVFVWHGRRRFNLGLELCHASRARAVEMSAYTGKTFAMLVVGSTMGSIDRFLLGKLAPHADFTNYTNGAVNVGSRLQSLGVGLMGPVFHNTSRTSGAGGRESSAAIYNETFRFVFGWYLLAAIWTALWHPVLLQLWLGHDRGMQVAPLFTPVIIAFCITAISGISTAQLSALNRLGTCLGFTVALGISTVAGVMLGWRWGGILGVAYGFLFSRIMCLVQDIYAIRLIGAGGWLCWQTWKSAMVQLLVGAFFAVSCLLLPRSSSWLFIPAVLHGVLVGGGLAWPHLRKRFLPHSPAQVHPTP